MALKSICVHLGSGSQLVCTLMHMLVIVTTVRIFVVNLHTESVHSKKAHGKGHIPFADSGISTLTDGTYS